MLLTYAAYDETSAKLIRALVDARILLSAGEGSQATVRLAPARVLDSCCEPRRWWRRTQAENAGFYRIRAKPSAAQTCVHQRWQRGTYRQAREQMDFYRSPR